MGLIITAIRDWRDRHRHAAATLDVTIGAVISDEAAADHLLLK